MKTMTLIIVAAITLAAGTTSKSFYDFKIKTLEGKDFDFSTLKGKKVLIVNTASRCGNTPQYAELEKLYKTYKDQNFVIIGFPCNDFGKQEPGTNKDIAEFCSKNYGVTFSMMEKITVKGNDMHPVYKWLTSKAENGVEDSEVEWNFRKYMVDEKGHLVGSVDNNESPLCDKIVKWIQKN